MALLSLIIEGPDAMVTAFAPGPRLVPARLGLAYTVLMATALGAALVTLPPRRARQSRHKV